MKFLLTFLCGATLWGQSGIQPPAIGMMKDPAGALRTVWGVSGSFVLGDPGANPVLAVFSAGGRTFVKDASSLQMLAADGSVLCAQPANDGPAKAGFSADGKQAVVFLPNDGLWLRWHEGDDQFQTLDMAIDGDVQDVGFDGFRISALVARDSRLWLVRGPATAWYRRQEQVIDGVPALAALGKGGAVIWYDNGSLRRRLPSGEEQSVDFPSDVAGYTSLGRGWLAVSAADGSNWALRFDQSDLQVFLLPGVEQ